MTVHGSGVLAAGWKHLECRQSPNYREEWRTKQRNQARLLFLSETEWSLIHTCEMKVSPTLFARTLEWFSFFRDPESHWTSCRSKREIYYLKPGLTRLTWMLLWTPLFTNWWAMICKSHHVLFTVEHRKLRKFTVLRKNNKVILKLMAATRLSKVGKRARKVSGIKTKHLEVCFASN